LLTPAVREISARKLQRRTGYVARAWRDCRRGAAPHAILAGCARRHFCWPISVGAAGTALNNRRQKSRPFMEALRRPSRELAREFERALAEQLPLIKRDGGFVRRRL